MAFKMWEWDKDKPLTGKLVAKLKDLGPWKKRMYGIETESGEVFYFWGTSILVGKIAPLNFLTKVRIKFIGKGFEAPEDAHPKMLYDFEVLELPTRKNKGGGHQGKKLPSMPAKKNAKK
jgi:hypothetical protein